MQHYKLKTNSSSYQSLDNQCGPESGFTNSLQIITQLPAEIRQESEVH